jgi:hypothetical protein
MGGVQRNASILKWVNDRYPNRWEDRTLGSHLRGCSVNNPIGIKYHPHFPRFLFKRGSGEFELYDSQKHGNFDDRGNPAYAGLQVEQELDDLREITEVIQARNEFANEAQLRDYLARNLGLLESGLTLWSGSEAESVEYALEGRRVDILAKDREGVPVVVELKLSKGHERTLGQALYYRGKVKQLLKVSRVRIIMVASEITDELRIASMEVSDVDIFAYTLTMQVHKVDLRVAMISEPGDSAIV